MSDGGDTLYLDASPGERRAALVDGAGDLQRIEIDRDGRPRHAETILAARVTALDAQTGTAFLDGGPLGPLLLAKAGKLREGDAVTVQISREAEGRKNPVAVRGWTLTGRYLAWSAGRTGIGWARAIGQGRARADLEGRVEAALEAVALDDAADMNEGLFVRPQALTADAKALAGELAALARRRDAVRAAEASAKAPAVLEAAPAFTERVARDAPAGARIATDDRVGFARLEKLAAEWRDLAAGLAFRNPAKGALFAEAGLDEALEDSLARRVAIPGGGRLTIDETEAMVVIDVDSGGGQGGGAQDGGGLKEEAVFRLNKRAADEAARQIRLRNLAGLIVVDFVTLRGKGRMKGLLDKLRARMREDPVKADVLGATAAGLVEITRQRTGPSLAELMLVPRAEEPPRAADAQAAEILRAALRLRGAGRPVAYASSAVEAALKGPLAEARAACERRLGTALEIRRGPDSLPPRVEMERS